jgi:hypothetical protein
MSKLDRKKKRDKAKGAQPRITLAGGESIAQRPTGRDRRHTNQPETSGLQALIARCRHAGVEPTADRIREMRAPWNGCNAGRAMAAEVLEERERGALWDAIQHVRRTVAAYDRAVGAPARHPVCLRLLLPLEALTADAATPPADDRTEAERERQAVSAWTAVKGWLGHAPTPVASAAWACIVDDAPARSGLVDVLRRVADGIAGRQIVYRA